MYARMVACQDGLSAYICNIVSRPEWIGNHRIRHDRPNRSGSVDIERLSLDRSPLALVPLEQEEAFWPH